MRVLYICTGNSHRSPLAEALTRKYHSQVEVESAGTDAVGHVSEIAHEEAGRENAKQYLKPEPDQLSRRAVEEADKIICMMPRHKGFLERNFNVKDKEVEVWNVRDPINPGVKPEKSFQEIKERVKEL